MVLMTNRTITTEDGRALAADWFSTATSNDTTAARSTLLLAPATGVRRSFYVPFAQHLAEQGHDVLLWDTRGIGDSRCGNVRSDIATMFDWGRFDLEAMIRHARVQSPSRKLILLGHSSGGHLCGLAPSLDELDAIVLIASGTADWRDYQKSQWPRLFAAWYLALPLVVALFGYLPGWAGVGQHLPAGVAWQWRRWGLTKGYLFGDPNIDCSRYRLYRGAVRAVSIADDHDFAPQGPVTALLNQFAGADKSHHVIHPAGQPIGHFGFFRTQHAAHWPVVTDWLNERLGKARSRTPTSE